MDKFELDFYTNPFSTNPLKEPMYLDENTAKNIMTVGFFGIITPVLLILSAMDPWANMFWNLKKLDFYEYGLFLLVIITAFIAYKQWGYYYWTEAGGKKGIFKNRVKQVNNLERSLDFILAISGALLLAFAAFPVVWFFALAIYSFLVTLRCYFTLKRKDYAKQREKEGKNVPRWYTEALDKTWHKFVVKQVLAGWVASHFLIGVYSLLLFILFYLIFHSMSPEIRMLFLLISSTIVISLYYFGSKISYDRFSPMICNWMEI